MKKATQVTLLAATVLSLISFDSAFASSSNSSNPNQKSIISADQVESLQESSETSFHAAVQISRNTSLYDHQDGTRKDGLDYLVVPSLKTFFGGFSAKVAYSQDLKDESTTASDWTDVPVTFSFIPNKWEWSPPYILTLTPTLTAVAPLAKTSVQRDQLQTAFITGLSFGIIPDGIAAQKDGAWNLAIGLTAGRNFHAYSTDINGAVLNQYSSNQTLNVGYTYRQLSLSVEFIHKVRWTYQGNVKNSFEHTEEIGYGLTDHFSIALGHTNAGSTLKTNGSESNVAVINENDSLVYAALGMEF